MEHGTLKIAQQTGEVVGETKMWSLSTNSHSAQGVEGGVVGEDLRQWKPSYNLVIKYARFSKTWMFSHALSKH